MISAAQDRVFPFDRARTACLLAPESPDLSETVAAGDAREEPAPRACGHQRAERHFE